MNARAGLRALGVRAAALLAAGLLAGCAAAPMRGDPFEPANRVAFDVHEAIDSNVVRPAIQAYVDYTPELVRRGVSNFFANIDDCTRRSTRRCRASPTISATASGG